MRSVKKMELGAVGVSSGVTPARILACLLIEGVGITLGQRNTADMLPWGATEEAILSGMSVTPEDMVAAEHEFESAIAFYFDRTISEVFDEEMEFEQSPAMYRHMIVNAPRYKAFLYAKLESGLRHVHEKYTTVDILDYDRIMSAVHYGQSTNSSFDKCLSPVGLGSNVT